MKSLILVFFMSVLLLGCDSITEMLEEQQAAQSYIKDNFGWDSQVGFSYSNGTLTQVTLVLDSDDIGDQLVSEIEVIARKMVSKSFEKDAEIINIQISIVPR